MKRPASEYSTNPFFLHPQTNVQEATTSSNVMPLASFGHGTSLVPAPVDINMTSKSLQRVQKSPVPPQVSLKRRVLEFPVDNSLPSPLTEVVTSRRIFAPVISSQTGDLPAQATLKSNMNFGSFHGSWKQSDPSPGFSDAQGRSSTSTQVTFGTSSFSGKASVGSSSLWKIASPGLPISTKSLKPHLHLAQLKGDDTLSKAINRATRNRPSVIGHQELAADRLVANFLSSANESPNIQELATEIAGIAQTHIFAFLQYIFKEASGGQGVSGSAIYPSAQSRDQRYGQKILEDSFHLNFDHYGWGQDLGNYIMRMIVFGLTPREIRTAVKKEMNWNPGQNHAADEELESIVDWMRGPALKKVESA